MKSRQESARIQTIMSSQSKMQARTKLLQDASSREWDIIIIGGGITGAGIFRQASQDGLKTLLIEKNDFGSGTSWCSSKLIHGGLRYLEQGKIHLVFESISERQYLLQFAPALVKPLTFIFPVYKKSKRPLWLIYLGTWVYAALSCFKNIPKKITSDDIQNYSSKLTTTDFTGAVFYSDAVTTDTTLTLSCILSGQSDHALAVNHCAWLSHIEDSDFIRGIKAQDQLTQQQYTFNAKWVINATGPWTDDPYKEIGKLTYSQGSHLLFKGNPFDLHSAITMSSNDDGRILFCIPWKGHTLVGTTDTPSQQGPDSLKILENEKQYLLDILAQYFPTVDIHSLPILSHFSGLRTLVHNSDKKLSQLSREHIVNVPKKGLVEVYGGKLTCFSKIALDVLHKFQALDNSPRSQKHEIPFVTPKEYKLETLDQAQIQHMIDYEYAMTVSDILMGRTLAHLLLEDHGKNLYPLVCEVLQNNFGYSNEELEGQIYTYEKLSQQFTKTE